MKTQYLIYDDKGSVVEVVNYSLSKPNQYKDILRQVWITLCLLVVVFAVASVKGNL